MKKTFLVFTFLAFTVLLSGQNTAMEFFGMIPPLGVDPCSATPEQKEEFLSVLNTVDSTLRAQVEATSTQAEEFQSEHEDEVRINVLMKQGYSREQAEKLKDADNMSEAELMAIANEMMMNKNTVSLDEYNKVAEYDTASQGRWAKAQSTIYMSEVQSDPEKYQEEQLALKQDFELQAELKYQRDKLRAGEDKYRQQIDSLDGEAAQARVLMGQEIEKLLEDLENCQSDDQREAIIDRINDLRLDFCQKFTPRYLEITKQFKAYLVNNMNEYKKWEELQIRSVEAQTGLKDPNHESGSIVVAIVGSYLQLLADAFKYAPPVRVYID